MAHNKATIALEIAVLLVLLVAFEWLAYVVTDTRNMFVPAMLVLGIYVVLRMAVFMRRTRHPF